MNSNLEKNSRIAILGLGVEGESVREYLGKHECRNITLFDEKKQAKDVRNSFENLSEFDFVFRSPGIRIDQLDIADHGKLTSATKFFFDKCPCPIIGVTGTKGKGTTSTLIYEILKEAGRDVYLGGNIGTPALSFLDDLNKDSIVILELSSFQLQDLHKSPHIAVVLNTTSEHLDYHKDQEEYQAAKESIVKFQTGEDFVVVNTDYPYAERYLAVTKAAQLFMSVKGKVENGTYVNEDKIVHVENGEEEFISNKNNVGLLGPHNLENIMPAITVSKILNVSTGVIQKIIEGFTGLPHRLEFIREINDVSFFNDSFSTTPETCIAAIRAFKKPIVLIAGGSEKNSDYTELGKAIVQQKNLATVVLMGDTADGIEKSIDDANDKATQKDVPLNIIHADTYAEAFFAAYTNAEKYGVVLLSPASASFGLFKNYKHRGETFKKWVESL